jgi:hypothetical protein
MIKTENRQGMYKNFYKQADGLSAVSIQKLLTKSRRRGHGNV